MATKTAKTSTSRKVPVKNSDENNAISKSIIQDVIFGCEKMGIEIEVLKNLHAVWLMKIKDSDPNFYVSINTEWNDYKKNAKKLREKEKPKIKKVKRLISKLRIDRGSSSEKENLNVVGQKLKKNWKRNPILINNKITKSKIGLSMPLLGDEIDVPHTLKQLGHNTLITKHTGNISFNGEVSKCNIQNDTLALNVEQHVGKTEFMNSLHLGDSNRLKIKILQNIAFSPKYHCMQENEKLSEINNESKYGIKNDDIVLPSGSNADFQIKLSPSTSDSKNKLDCYSELVKTAELDHFLVNNKKDDEQIIIENENFDCSLDNSINSYNDNYDRYNGVFDEHEKQLPSIKAVVSDDDDDIEINQHLPLLPLKRKHSIKACGRKHRQRNINEQKWKINSRSYQVICEGRFLRSRFDYSKLDETFLDVVIFLPNRDPDQDEKRTCMIKVSSMILQNNNLDLIINPLLNTVSRFTEPEAAFVLQKSVDLIMEQIVLYQVDGPPSCKFSLKQINKYAICSSKKKLLYEEIDSADDISDEDDLNIEYDLNVEYKNCIYCRYKKIIKRRNSFSIRLYNGVIKINDNDFKLEENESKRKVVTSLTFLYYVKE